MKRLVYAHSVEQLHDEYADVTQNDVVLRHPGFFTYLGHVFERENTWALCFQHELPLGATQQTTTVRQECVR